MSMARSLLSSREEARGLVLAQRQPESAKALQDLIDTVKSRAIEMVMSDPKVKSRLEGQRSRVVGAELREEKADTESQKPRRLGVVGIFDYDRNIMVMPVVDLRAGTVVDIEERQGLQPPLTSEELTEARHLVLDSQEYASLRSVPVGRIATFPARMSFDPRHAAWGHRCFTLRFLRGARSSIPETEVVVDLSTRRVLGQDTPVGE